MSPGAAPLGCIGTGMPCGGTGAYDVDATDWVGSMYAFAGVREQPPVGMAGGPTGPGRLGAAAVAATPTPLPHPGACEGARGAQTAGSERESVRPAASKSGTGACGAVAAGTGADQALDQGMPLAWSSPIGSTDRADSGAT